MDVAACACPVVTTKHVSAVGSYVDASVWRVFLIFVKPLCCWSKNHDKHVAGAGKQGTQKLLAAGGLNETDGMKDVVER